jgi:hypothetical protein
LTDSVGGSSGAFIWSRVDGGATEHRKVEYVLSTTGITTGYRKLGKALINILEQLYFFNNSYIQVTTVLSLIHTLCNSLQHTLTSPYSAASSVVAW